MKNTMTKPFENVTLLLDDFPTLDILLSYFIFYKIGTTLLKTYSR